LRTNAAEAAGKSFVWKWMKTVEVAVKGTGIQVVKQAIRSTNKSTFV